MSRSESHWLVRLQTESASTVFPARPGRKLLHIAFWVLAAMAMLALALFLLRHPILRAAGAALVENDGAQKADCILVLGGDTFGYRIIKAGELAHQGYAPYVIVDGPKMLMGYESDNVVAFAVEHGFPPGMFRSIHLPAEINSTSAEAEYLANNVFRPQHIQKILLVTSNYHTRRAARFVREKAPWLRVAVVPAGDPYFSVDGWWKTREGRKTFFFEWMKTISEWQGD